MGPVLKDLVSPWNFELGCKFLLILNFFDAIFTLIWALTGSLVEANPIMASAILIGPGFFIWTKVILVCLGVWLLWKQRHRLWVRIIAIPLLLLYTFVVAGHIGAFLYVYWPIF